MQTPIVLASQSPRRRELMGLVTPNFTTCVADFDEDTLPVPKAPALYAMQLAEGKGAAAAQQHSEGFVIGCDTVVELGCKALGKPHSPAEAAGMLSALAGARHLVHTGVAIYKNGKGAAGFVAHTSVYFSPIPKEEIAAYIKTGEPYDKAGGYGIQGWAAKYIPRIDGCYYNVMGLPVADLFRALKDLGADL